jgi:pyridoxal biosynthesis lyase PdxS
MMASTATSLDKLNAMREDISVEAYNKQLRILGIEAINSATSLEELSQIQTTYKLKTEDTKNKALELTTTLNLLNQAYANNYISIDDYNKKVKEWVDIATQDATTLEELRVAVGQFMGDDNFIDSNPLYSDEYAQGLINLASKYDSCAEAVAEYQDALTTLASSTAENREEIKKMVEAAEEHLEMSIRAEEAASKHGLVLDTLKAQMNEIAKAEGVTEKTALEMAIANERMNRGVAELVNNWEDWKKILKESDKTAEDYAATLDDLSAAVTELVGWYDDLALDSEFVEENMGLIDKAAEGDVTSILKLGAAVAQLSIASADLDATLFSGSLADGSVNAF